MSKNLSKYQKFEVIRINRREILNAPYNPRSIKSENYNLLKKNLKRIGLIETLVWNKTTGNLIAGHQRIKIMDELEKRDDYEIDIACVEMNEKQEKEQNIFMNNPTSQGEFNRDLLLALAPEIDLQLSGFTDHDINVINVEFNLQDHKNEEVENIINDFNRIAAENKAAHIQKTASDPEHVDWKTAKKTIRANSEKVNGDTYMIIMFNTHEEKAVFCNKYGFDGDDVYVKGDILEKIMRDQLKPVL